MTDRLARRASELNNFVRVDMEDSSCTTDTLPDLSRAPKKHTNVGVVIQCIP
jgi:hypothetical protein